MRFSPIRQSSASAAVPSKTTAGTIGYPSPTALLAAANITLTGARATRDVRDASEIPGSGAAVLEVRIHLPPAASPQTFSPSR